MRVDRHDKQVDVRIEHHVDERPRHTVHVVLTRDTNRRTKSPLQLELACDQSLERGTIDAGVDMPPQSGETDSAGVEERAKSLYVALFPIAQPASDGLRCLACPFRPASFIESRRAF